ncbi:hypothetical protein [Kitasatospora sp. NPDC097691]|uniref:hypothetical protein n=1 Tax=Kitasatospora sp. NPDC097691 TaxID=3157231 RepID=UPI003318ECBB
MSTTPTEPQSITPPPRLAHATLRAVAAIGKAGDRLPAPVWLVGVLVGVVVVLGAVLEGW